MKFVTYAATAGLDRLPERVRFRVWHSTHKRLMYQDAAYRRRVIRFRSAILWTTVLYCIVPSLPSSMLGAASWPQGLSVAAFIVLTLGFIVFVVYASFRAQEFQNERIGREVENHEA
jgi:hypothetical protein